MALKEFRPLTPTLRFKSLPAFDEITKWRPERSLIAPKKRSGGRDVSRPRLLRPPLLFFGAIRLLSGRHFVISSKAGSDLKRSVGVSGRNSFRAITFLSLDQVDLVAFFQRHDGFLPPRTTSQRAAHTSLLAGVITSVHVHDCLLKKPLNCVLDLNLVRLRTDAEDVLVQLLAHQCRLLSQRGG